MSHAECVIPSLPSDAEDLLARLLDELRCAGPDGSESLAAVTKFSVALLLPRFAGTMLKLLHEGHIDPDERVVVLVTGNGLKDAETAIKAAGRPHLIEPTMKAVREFVSSRKSK